jgi:outer membrane receptor for ferrienterochelin and colicin
LGGDLSQSRVQPFTDFLPFSYFEREGDIRSTAGANVADIIPEEVNITNVGLYGQLYGNWKSLSALAVARYDKHSLYNGHWSTSLAAMWKLEEGSSLRINYSNAAQAPSPYFQARSYAVVTQADTAFVQLANPPLQRETNESFEVGLRLRRSDNFSTDIVYFRTRATQLVEYYETLDIADARLRYTAGYRNDRPTSVSIRGFQGRLRVGLPSKTEGQINFQFARGEEQLAFSEEKLERVRGVGRWTTQINTRTRFTRRWFIQSVHTFSQSWLSRSWNAVNGTGAPEDNIIPNYYVLDLIVRYQLSNEFQGFVQVLNTLNRSYAGIGVDRAQDALLYNAQHLRTFRVGLNYSMR